MGQNYIPLNRVLRGNVLQAVQRNHDLLIILTDPITRQKKINQIKPV